MSTRQKFDRHRPPPGTGRAGRPANRASNPEQVAALQRRIADLEGQLQARDNFLAIAAHELRNPMTPISARLELLLAKARGASQSLPSAIVQGLERLEQLVDAYVRRATILLDIARFSSGNLRLHNTEVNLSAVVRQVVANLTPLAERAGSRIGLAVEEGVTGHCDAMALEQILENLLSNAIRYGAGRPIEVTLSGNGSSARLAVCDRGLGIAEVDQAQIFERFHNLRRPGPKGGFGVGLWVARQLVQALDGEISVASAPGEGSTFTVRLPLQPAERNGD
jgi:signal transduction histidine kinase